MKKNDRLLVRGKSARLLCPVLNVGLFKAPDNTRLKTKNAKYEVNELVCQVKNLDISTINQFDKATNRPTI
jgi:hypothetical protein